MSDIILPKRKCMDISFMLYHLQITKSTTSLMVDLLLIQALVPVLLFFQNLLETFLKYTFKEDGSDTFKADGIIILLRIPILTTFKGL